MQLDDVIQNLSSLAPDPVCVAYRDTMEGTPRVRWVNKAFCETFGMTAESAIGMPSYDLFHWEYLADFKEVIAALHEKGELKVKHDTLCIRADKSSFWASLSFTAVPDDSGPGRHGILMIRDIDDLKNREQSAELALIENEHLLREVEAAQTRLINSIEMIPDPFAIYDSRDRLVIWNPAYARSTTSEPDKLRKGMKKAEILRIALNEGIFADAIGREDLWLENYTASWRSRSTNTYLMKIRGRDYKTIESEAPNGDRVVFRIDISEQLRQSHELETYARRLEQANNEISHQALHDELTGLGNRRFLNMQLDDLIAEREAIGGELAALHVDLDRFKQINDTMGHAAGDHVLCVVADILRRGLRKNDVVARTGGDEFVVLLKSGAESTEPEALAERLIAEISKPIPFEDRLCRLGASVGIARTPVIDAQDLVTSSDVALYKAKQGGRSTLAVFDHIDLENLRASKRLADDILRGIEEDEFVPVYQAQIDPIQDSIVGFEVLARWQHPNRGLLSPGEFLGMADDTHVTGLIDGMIFRRAIGECKQGFAGQDDPPSLSFNVGLQRIMDPTLEDDVRDADYPGPVAFELIETVFVDSGSEEFLNRIAELRGLGLTFEVDDFGSGRASIVGLRQIGADRLKIDHRLVQPITNSASARKLVESIIDIGRALDIAVTAEGIETEQHARVLTTLGCDRLQGFYFARPMPLNKAVALFNEERQFGLLNSARAAP